MINRKPMKLGRLILKCGANFGQNSFVREITTVNLKYVVVIRGSLVISRFLVRIYLLRK